MADENVRARVAATRWNVVLDVEGSFLVIPIRIQLVGDLGAGVLWGIAVRLAPGEQGGDPLHHGDESTSLMDRRRCWIQRQGVQGS